MPKYQELTGAIFIIMIGVFFLLYLINAIDRSISFSHCLIIF